MRRAAAVVIALLSGCPDDAPEVAPIDVPPPVPEAPERAAAEPAQLDEGYVVAELPAGTVEGIVRWQGPVPPGASIDVHAQHRTCGRTQSVPPVTVDRAGGVAHAVVSMVDVDRGPRAMPEETPVLDQVGCRYVPHTLAVVQGAPVTFRNSDGVLHNVHAIWEDGSDWFNVGQPREGMSTVQVPERTGVARIVCDAGHAWMLAWVHVFDHPYFAVTGEDGAFRIEEVPAGEQTIRLWHQGWEQIGSESGRPRWSDPIEVRRTVQVEPGGTARIELVLPPTPDPSAAN